LAIFAERLDSQSIVLIDVDFGFSVPPGNIERDIRTAIEPHWRKMKQNAHAQHQAEFKDKRKAELAEEKKRYFEETICQSHYVPLF
jgi:hypothetical protein